MTALMIWQGIGIAPDRYAFILLLGSLLVRRTRSFVLDWIPFLFILISYDFLRGFADNLSSRVHYIELINADKFLFTFVPTVALQDFFYQAGNLRWYDYLATIFYFLHFALPLGFGFLLWIISKNYFRVFVLSILLLSYAGWISYLVYPAAPPWLAKEQGYLPGVHKILDETLKVFPAKFELPTIYHKFNPNPVAAIPSMHAAYPLLVLLYCLRFFKLKGLIFTPYVLGVWLSLIYLGEHYVIDVIIGAIYALFFYTLANLLYYKIKSHPWLKRMPEWLLGWNVRSAKVVITLPKKILLRQKKK